MDAGHALDHLDQGAAAALRAQPVDPQPTTTQRGGAVLVQDQLAVVEPLNADETPIGAPKIDVSNRIKLHLSPERLTHLVKVVQAQRSLTDPQAVRPVDQQGALQAFRQVFGQAGEAVAAALGGQLLQPLPLSGAVPQQP